MSESLGMILPPVGIETFYVEWVEGGLEGSKEGENGRVNEDLSETGREYFAEVGQVGLIWGLQ